METTIFVGRQTTEKDYEILVGWWNHYGFPPPAPEFLPDMGKCGIMVEDQDGKPLCAGFIYETNSKVCWMEMIVANPQLEGNKRNDAILYLIDSLSYLAYEWQYKWIYTSLKHEKLKEKYMKAGFQIGQEGTMEMIKQL